MSRSSYHNSEGPSKAFILKSDQAGWVNLSTPYNRDYIENLKVLINPSMRKYDPESKLWSIREVVLEDVTNLLKIYFDEVVNYKGQKEVKPGGDLFVQLFNVVPEEYKKKVYFALCQAIHPDHVGGSNELMIQLNRVYQSEKK